MPKYEYKTVVGNIRYRNEKDFDDHSTWISAPMTALMTVDDPVPPDGDGWELLCTVVERKREMPDFVLRDWRREVKA